MIATTTIRINHATLPEEFDRRRPDVVAEVIQTALLDDEIEADASDVISHIKIELPTSQLADALPILSDLKLI